MKVQLKEEYKNSKIEVRTAFNRRVQVDTSKSDIMKFADIAEFAFMFEPKEQEKPNKTKEPLIEAVENEGEFFQADNQQKELSEYTLKELRTKFPDIDAKSKKSFLSQLAGEQ
jgi:hypothetical protein